MDLATLAETASPALAPTLGAAVGAYLGQRVSVAKLTRIARAIVAPLAARLERLERAHPHAAEHAAPTPLHR